MSLDQEILICRRSTQFLITHDVYVQSGHIHTLEGKPPANEECGAGQLTVLIATQSSSTQLSDYSTRKRSSRADYPKQRVLVLRQNYESCREIQEARTIYSSMYYAYHPCPCVRTSSHLDNTFTVTPYWSVGVLIALCCIVQCLLHGGLAICGRRREHTLEK